MKPRTPPREAFTRPEAANDQAAEHDWLATLNLVQKASDRVKQAGAAPARPHVAPPAPTAVEDEAPGATPRAARRLSAGTLAGIGGALLSWAALLWVVFAPDPFMGWAAASPAVTRHHFVTLAQCGLLTSLAALIALPLRTAAAALTASLARRASAAPERAALQVRQARGRRSGRGSSAAGRTGCSGTAPSILRRSSASAPSNRSRRPGSSSARTRPLTDIRPATRRPTPLARSRNDRAGRDRQPGEPSTLGSFDLAISCLG